VEWVQEARPYLTMENFVNSVKFVVILLMALISGAANLIPKILTILNSTIRESGVLIKQFSPFMLACVDMVGKVVGGFYMLIAMVWRDFRNPQPPPQRDNKLLHKRNNYLEGPRYPYRRENVQRPYL
jgi:hypothetical protein